MLFLHWIGNRMLSLVTNVLYNTMLTDMETCYKLVDRSLLMRGLRLRSDRFDIEPEITAKILKRRATHLREVPISYTGREFDGEGKKITWRDGLPRPHLLERWPSSASWRLNPIRFERPAWAAASSSNYETGAVTAQAAVRSVLADTKRRRAGSTWW